MFTTDSGYGWHATPEAIGSVWLGDRPVILSGRGMGNLAKRLVAGESAEAAINAVIYADGDFGHDVVGWWRFVGRGNPWRMIGRVEICRSVEYGKVCYTATSVITDSCSKTLPHLLGRLARMQAGAAKKERAGKRSRRRVQSDGEVWARRHEEGWGPGGY